MIATDIKSETVTFQLPGDLNLQVTPGQFAAIAAVNPELKLERTATGDLIVNPPTGGETGKRNLRISTQLGNWYEAHPELGEAFDSSTGFTLPNGANRSPDAAWVSRARWQALTPAQQKGFVPLSPDFVIELRSESDSLAKLQSKLQEYIDNGTELGWLIDPQQQQVEIYRAGQGVEIVVNPSQLSGEGVLPGFVLNWQRVWS
jgi:Uma2 family endonuclease